MLKKTDTLLYEKLLEKNLVTKETLDVLLKEAEAQGDNLIQCLVKRGLFFEKDVLKILAEALQLKFLDLKSLTIDKVVFEKVPVRVASYYKFIPIELKDRTLTLAVSYPLDIKIQDEIRTQLGYDIEFALVCAEDIQDVFRRYYGFAAETLEKITSQTQEEQPAASVQETYTEKIEDIEKLADNASVKRLVNQIILEGFRKRATDIHIEPYRGEVNLRYRIDGLLYDTNVSGEIKNFLNAIISRIKIMSNLNIVERRLPQDGRAVVKVQDETLDLRISTMPTPYGESVVIRILPAQMLFSLEKLGLSKKDLQIFEMLIQKPHGIIFVTGPTGSGKTTTLYASLSRINTKERKIITIEDPIEYEMRGITQIQVMPEIGLDFARGLRSILRHDPDVIMVGEVRDLETAEIAIRVALTGHLIFSTLHTNDAASGIARLLDIGVEQYLLASSVEAFIAQRLIRLICPDCKYEDTNAPIELKSLIAEDLQLKSLEEIKIFKGRGCPNCNSTGFFSRTAIYEVLLVDDAIKDLILKKTSSNQIKKIAIQRGMRTLRQDGWQKAIAGLTTPEEVMKATSVEEKNTQGSKADVFFTFSEKEESEVLQPQDKRIFPRLDHKVNVRYKIFKGPKDDLHKDFTPEQLSVTKNISAGGLRFFSNEAVPVGVMLEFHIELPGGEESIECLARVVRIEESLEEKGYEVAVCFLDITSAQRAMLEHYVERKGE